MAEMEEEAPGAFLGAWPMPWASGACGSLKSRSLFELSKRGASSEGDWRLRFGGRPVRFFGGKEERQLGI